MPFHITVFPASSLFQHWSTFSYHYSPNTVYPNLTETTNLRLFNKKETKLKLLKIQISN